MIRSEKVFFILLQTLGVGVLCVSLVVSNIDNLKASNNVSVGILGSVVVTLISGFVSIGLAEN